MKCEICGSYTNATLCKECEKAQVKKDKKPKPKQKWEWYYAAEFGAMYGIWKVPAGMRPREYGGNLWGPFSSFGEAKHDALGYFRTDIEESKRAFKATKAFLKHQSEALLKEECEE